MTSLDDLSQTKRNEKIGKGIFGQYLERKRPENLVVDDVELLKRLIDGVVTGTYDPETTKELVHAILTSYCFRIIILTRIRTTLIIAVVELLVICFAIVRFQPLIQTLIKDFLW